MTLVIKNKNVTLPEGEKLFRDALVTDGTLFLIDFSNRGTTNAFQVNNGDMVMDLARESSNPMGIDASSAIYTPNNANELTAEYGFTTENIPSVPSGGFGLRIPSVMDYLSENQGHNFLFSLWMNTGEGNSTRPFVRTSDGEDTSNMALRCNISTSGISTFTVGGAVISGSQFYPVANTPQRVAYLYKGVGNPVEVWVNGQHRGDSPNLATGFDAIGYDVVIGRSEGTSVGNQTIYRMLIEDLTVTGRVAAEVAMEDYEYVNAIGKYEGIDPRPFKNI